MLGKRKGNGRRKEVRNRPLMRSVLSNNYIFYIMHHTDTPRENLTDADGNKSQSMDGYGDMLDESLMLAK